MDLQTIPNWWRDLSSFANQASDEAERRFPNQDRDESQKNAFRHALGAGRFAQLLGSNSGIPIIEDVAKGAAKLGGYGWEYFSSGAKKWGSNDMRHDTNANAIGIQQSSNYPNQKSLADALESYAWGARKESPPQLSERGQPYFTFGK